MIEIFNIITPECGVEIYSYICPFFENEILAKITCRPMQEIYGDLVERSKGRFEIIPPKWLEKKIWGILLQNESFVKINQELRRRIGIGRCVQELGILPVEANTPAGSWHRDVFLEDFERSPYYITQIIYLDNKSSTELCIDSHQNSNSDPDFYYKKRICAELYSSLIFDGRTLNRGLSNNTDTTRYAIYISYYESSYIDLESILPNFADIKKSP